ncbi:NAD(P)H-dependent oxidoreductase [Chryseobacterium ginsenosidimutans]|uniref:FMN-dependent NADH-azoreductase n=1 Tax=Chryseobacterium ginsenosidimutans TaxID=687846 RepID=UPI0031D77933
MKKILHISSSPKIEKSSSRKLGKEIVRKITEKYPDSRVQEYDLTKIQIPHLDEQHINSFFTSPHDRSSIQNMSIRHSDLAIYQLQEADIIVIEAPMYNFTITSTLKAYFDSIARSGITFRYTGKGLLPEGLLKHKQAYIATSSGGIYSEGELKKYDFATNYTRFFLELIGINVIDIFRSEGQAIIGEEEALQNGINSIVIK